MDAELLIQALNQVMDSAEFRHLPQEEMLALAVIWVIERVASELTISHAEAADQVSLMCETTYMMSIGARS